MSKRRQNSIHAAIVLGLLTFTGIHATDVAAAEAKWIWSADVGPNDAIEVGETCYFRKIINLRERGEGILEIAADDEYEVHVNERIIGRGESYRAMKEFDISDYLEVGRNVVAIRVKNTSGDTAALVARVSVRPENESKWYTFSSDKSWRTSLREEAMWDNPALNDRSWQTALVYGDLGETIPWDREPNVQVETAKEKTERFQIQKGFGVQRLINDEQVGSIIAMVFDEFGHLVLSQEQGPTADRR